MGRAWPYRRGPGPRLLLARGVLLALVAGLSVPAPAQPLAASAQPAANVMAAFVYKLTGYIHWPVSEQTGRFRLTVVGDSPLAEPLAEIARKKKVGDRAIDFRKVGSVAEVGNPHLLVVGTDAVDEIMPRLKELWGGHTLVVTHEEGGARKGASVNFVTRDGRVRFEVNLASLQEASLVPLAGLLKLAIIVEEDGPKEEP